MFSSNNGSKQHEKPFYKKPLRSPGRWSRLKFRRDYRASLPSYLSRFTGYRDPEARPPYEPLPFPPFTWLHKIPLEVETWIFAWIGSFIGVLLVEAIMSANTAFQMVYHTPIIITSFGASAVLIYGVIESPVAQPRCFVGGHIISAFMGTWITRLWVLDPNYYGYLNNARFHANTFVNGGLSMATALLLMLVTGTAYPPAGATALNAAVVQAVVKLSWRYLPVVLVSALIMLGWAMIINNLGRRRYPLHWWAPGATFIVEDDGTEHGEANEEMEDGRVQQEHHEEGDLERESIESEAGAERAEEPEGVVPGLDAEPADLEDLGDVMEGR